MSIQKQLIERFIRTNTPFNILTSTRHRLYVDPRQQKDYDGTLLKAQVGFPNATVSVPALVELYDPKLIKQTSFQTQEEKLSYIDMILKESGFNTQHRKNQKLIDELSNYLDELDRRSMDDIKYYDIKLQEINRIGFYGNDLLSTYDIWYPNLERDIENTGGNFIIEDKQSNGEILEGVFDFCLTNMTEMYFTLNRNVLGEIYKLTYDALLNKVSSFSNPLSIHLAKRFEIKEGYLFLHNYEIHEDERIALLIIPINTIIKLGYLRASGGAMVQFGYSKMPKWERIRRMYVESVVDISYNQREETLSGENKEYLASHLKEENK